MPVCPGRAHRALASLGGPLLAAIVLLGALGVAPPPAMASHYRLTDDLGLLAPGERKALSGSGIKTTKALLEATAARSSRAATAKTTGISEARLAALAAQCDLLRVRGVGPSAVMLLQAVGVPHAKALGAQAPSGLHALLEAEQARRNQAAVVPSSSELSDWIGQANRLPDVLEGNR